jgi:SAM-dependent methyltransferase
MNDRLVHEFVRSIVNEPADFVATIHPDDEMHLWRPGAGGVSKDSHLEYLITGRRMVSDLRRIVDWAFGGFGAVGIVLDFASGYGRLTRHLIQEVPADRIWISDIQAEGVQFQIDTFGVHGFVSSANPRDLQCDQSFDLVFVASLFSHLPHETFTPWLDRLYRLLTRNGVLVFSVHDAMLTSLEPTENGIAFIPRSESDRLDPNTYGTSYVSEAYVTRAVERVAGRPGRVRRIRQGLCDYQDLYVVVGESRDDPDTLDASRGFLAYIDHRNETVGSLEIGGWAHDFSSSESTADVEVTVNGDAIVRCPAAARRPDVASHFGVPSAGASGWFVCIPVSDLDPEDAVMVRATSSLGREVILLCDTAAALR